MYNNFLKSFKLLTVRGFLKFKNIESVINKVKLFISNFTGQFRQFLWIYYFQSKNVFCSQN